MSAKIQEQKSMVSTCINSKGHTLTIDDIRYLATKIVVSVSCCRTRCTYENTEIYLKG